MAKMQLRVSDEYEPRIDIGALSFAILPPDARGRDMLLVVEISDSSLGFDTGAKAATSALGGGRDYWVVNAGTRKTLVHREPGPDGYGVRFKVAANATVTPLLVPELAVRLDQLKAAE